MTDGLPNPKEIADALFLHKLLSASTVLLAMVLGAMQLFGLRRNRVSLDPAPLEVRQAHEFARKADLEKALEDWRRERDQLHAKLGGMERGIREEIRRDIEQLHDKLNMVALATAKLEATTALLNQTMTGLSVKLDRATERGVGA
ncbi:MAG: hypothetical protein ACKVYV_11915 [Limisphaerales bacterium]